MKYTVMIPTIMQKVRRTKATIPLSQLKPFHFLGGGGAGVGGAGAAAGVTAGAAAAVDAAATD